MPLAAPRPLQIALGTSVIKLRLRQSVAVLRRAKVFDSDESSGDGGIGEERKKDAASSAALAPLDLIEFRSAPRLWVPEAKDLPLGKISLVASYEDVVDESGSVDASSSSSSSSSAAAAATAAAPPLVAPKATPFHLSPRRPRTRSDSGSPFSSPVTLPRQRIRIDVTATADFQPEGWMATFKRPLESVMLAMVSSIFSRFFFEIFFRDFFSTEKIETKTHLVFFSLFLSPPKQKTTGREIREVDGQLVRRLRRLGRRRGPAAP